MTYPLFVKRFLLPYLKDGSKRLEIQRKTNRTKNIRTGDTLDYNSGAVQRTVRNVYEYNSIAAALSGWRSTDFCPGWGTEDVHDALKELWKRETLNLLVFELDPPSP